MPTIEDLAVALAASLPDDMLARGALSESARLIGLALRSVRAEALEEAARAIKPGPATDPSPIVALWRAQAIIRALAERGGPCGD